MTWDAAVIIVRRPDGRILGVSHGSNLYDINLPGGMRETGDSSPSVTARRELKEETGLEVQSLRPIARWTHRGRQIVAFQGLKPSGELRASPEGQPAWVQPKRLTRTCCTFQRENGKLLERL